MHIVQLLLPLRDNDGTPFSDQTLSGIRQTLIDKFGGVTAYDRAPAEGVWARNGAEVEEPVVVIEVMAGVLDEQWWHQFRLRLERELGQEEIIIRSHEARKL